MEVREIMTSEAVACTAETNLAAAAASMWEHNCGILPVVDEGRQVTGVITDRDICIALATRNRLASDITVGEVSAGRAYTCRPDEDVHALLSIMRDHKVRRVPVVEHDGRLAGIVSIDDIVTHARERKGAQNRAITYTEVVETQKAIAATPIPHDANGSNEGALRNGSETVHTGDFDFEE